MTEAREGFAAHEATEAREGFEALVARAAQEDSKAHKGHQANAGTRIPSGVGGDSGLTHWAERVVADFLDANGIAWEYEPTLFVLSWSPEGQPASGMRPDFYLPDHDAYVEVTVQKPCTRKNRKIRQLREQHPGIIVRLLNRSDVARLVAGDFELHELLT